ncbi:MAG: septum formation protein Maf [candidate division NC10 bacterium]|nr:septum formation protein Maf [candidate division NC10 bacterium]
MPEIILASASPRRAALLRQIGLPFRVYPSALDENGACLRRSRRGRQAGPGPDGENPEARACRLARAKAEDVAARLGRGLIIGADTIVVCEGIGLGKPRHSQEAREFLRRLAGRTHQVITGVAVTEAETGRAEVAAATTLVRMRAFDPVEAAAYVATGEPLDKAGAYAIQGRGALLVEGIEGDYSTIVGLPLPTLAMLLRRFSLDLWEAART